MRVPKPIINGGEQWLALAMQRFRALKASASPLHTRTQIIQPDPDTTIEVHVSPSVDRIKIDSAPGVEVSSGLVNIGTISPATVPPTPRKFSRFYPGSIQSAPENRAWVDTAKLNYRATQGEPAQAVTIRSSMFTGAMEKVVAVALGANQRVPWSWTWAKTHGVHYDLSGKAWLIEVSAEHGVMAMKFPSTKAIKPKAAESQIRKSLGFLPGFSSFPEDESKLGEAIAEGIVLQLALPEALAEFYASSAIVQSSGWAFNSKGSECMNICLATVDGARGSACYKIEILTSESGPTGASILMVASGKGYGAREYNQNLGRRCDGTRLFIPTILFNGDRSLAVDYSTEFQFGTVAPDFSLTQDSPAKAPFYVFYDDGDSPQIFYQTHFVYNDVSDTLASTFFSGLPAYDAGAYPRSPENPEQMAAAATHACDFIGQGIPSASHQKYPPDSTTETVYAYLGQYSNIAGVVLGGSREQAEIEVAQFRARYDAEYGGTPYLAFDRADYSLNSGIWRAEIYYSYGVQTAGTRIIYATPPNIVSYRSNSIAIPAFTRSCLLCISNHPTVHPPGLREYSWGQYNANGAQVYEFLRPDYTPDFNLIRADRAPPELQAAFAALDLASQPSMDYSVNSAAEMILSCRSGVFATDLEPWLHAEDALAVSERWADRPRVADLLQYWEQDTMASLYPDFAFAQDRYFTLYAGMSAFKSSSFYSKEPGQIEGAKLAYDAKDSEPIEQAQANQTDVGTSPLMLGWVGYS